MFPDGHLPLYRAALAHPHRATIRVQVWSGEDLLVPDLPVVGGQVKATLTNRVARTCEVVVDESWFPWHDDDPLAELGNELHAWRGVELGNGRRIEFPVFRGRIQKTRMPDRAVTVSCVDYAGDVVDAEFEQPENSNPANRVGQEIRRLITQARQDAVFDDATGVDEPVPAMTWETDRGRALDDLAASAGAFWYPLADGRFTVRKVPWAQPPPDPSTVEILADGPGGIVESSSVERSREQIVNAVTVVAERLDGSSPAAYTARDLDPGSATYYFGRFGRKARTLSIPAAGGQPQCRAAAETFLARTLARRFAWEVTCVPDGSIELGDVTRLRARGRDVQHVVAGYTMPLTTAGAMTIQLRQFTPGLV